MQPISQFITYLLLFLRQSLFKPKQSSTVKKSTLYNYSLLCHKTRHGNPDTPQIKPILCAFTQFLCTLSAYIYVDVFLSLVYKQHISMTSQLFILSLVLNISTEKQVKLCVYSFFIGTECQAACIWTGCQAACIWTECQAACIWTECQAACIWTECQAACIFIIFEFIFHVLWVISSTESSQISLQLVLQCKLFCQHKRNIIQSNH